MKTKMTMLLLLTGLALVSAGGWAADKVPGQDKADESLIRTLNVPMDIEANQLYVDLAREIDRSERDRRVQGNARLAEEGVSLLQAQIKERQAELENLQSNLKTLDSLQTKINEDIKNRIENNPNVRLLVTLYESLSPDQAANLIKRLPMTVSLKMVQMMSPKKFSKILASMDPKYASELSRRLIREPAVAASTEAGGK